MSTISKSNNSYALLAGNATFTGLIEKLPLNDISITVALTIDQPVSVVINQYRNSSEASKVSEIIQAVSIGDTGLVQVPIIGLWANISVTNTTPTNMTTTSITTFFQTTNYANINIRDLTDTRDKINMMGLSPTNTQIQIALDAEGRLITSGGGGGGGGADWSQYPATQNVDIDGNNIDNVNNISADIVATDILKGYKNSPLGSILVQNNLDMDGKSISGANNIITQSLTSPNNTDLSITSSQVLTLYSVDNISIQTESLDKDPNTLEFSNLGNLTFSEGQQNINNLLGVTTSKSFTLTAGGSGKIVFSDLTEMTTASTGGGGNFSTPSNQDLDMDSHKIINITELGSSPNQPLLVNNDITFNTNAGNYINNVSDIVGSNVGGNDPYLQIQNLTSIITPGELQVNVTGGVGFYNGTNLNLHEGIISDIGDLRFSDLSIQTTAYQNPFQTQLDLNGNSVIGTQQIFGNSDITVTAGVTDTAESSTLSLTNNGYEVAGTYSKLFLKPTGVELNTGDITAATDFKATLDTAGVFTAPKLNISGTTDGITFANVNNYISGDGLTIFTPTDTALQLTTNGNGNTGESRSNITMDNTGIKLQTGLADTAEQYAIFDTAGLFTAPQFKVAQEIIGYGLDMSKAGIINVSNILSAPETNINIDGYDADSQVIINANTSGIGGTSSLSVAPAGIVLNTLITGTEDTASATFLPQSGTFTAPFFVAQGFQPTVGVFQKGSISAPLVNNVDTITFSDLTGQSTAYTGDDVKTITSTDGSVVITEPSPNTVNLSVAIPPSITSNTFYVNDNVNTINDVLPLMGSGDICIVSAGSFGNTVDINWNVAQAGLSGSVAPLPLTFLTTANASRFTVSAVQVRVANIKFQMPVFLSNNNLTVDNCDFDDNLTVGTGVSGYITINNCEFVGTKTVTVASSFANVCYFINCNFLGSTFVLSQASASQVIFNNCAGFTTYPANATYVGINVLSAGTAQLSTNDIKSVSGTLRLTSGLNVNSQAFTNVGTMSPPTSQQISFTNGLNIPSGSLNMRFNNIFNAGTITWTTGLTTIASASATRNLYTVSIPAFVSGANADFVMNDLGVFSTKSVTLTTAGQITYPDTTTQNSGLIKGTATLVAGTVTITDARVTTGAICVVSYADSPPVGGVLCAKVTTGQIIIESTLLADVSPIFYMYFI